MKSRPSLPTVNVYLNEATPVRVHIQKPKLLPSVVELNTSNELSEEDLDVSSKSNCMAEDFEAELSQTSNKDRAIWKTFEKLQELDLKGMERKGLAEESKLSMALKEAEATCIAAAKQVAILKNSIAELMQPGMDCTYIQVEVLMQKLTKSKSKNIHLKSKLLEAERNAEEVSEMYQKEKDNSFFEKQLSKSIGATQAHLQGQLQNKEAVSDRMLAQILRLERTITYKRLQIEHLRALISTVKNKTKEDKTVLKKAAQTQKRRAERFEAAMGNLNSQMKDKEMKLLEAQRTLGSWNRQYSAVAEDKAQLETEVISLSGKADALKEQLKKTTERATCTSRELLEKLHITSSENACLHKENAQLKVSLAALEERTTVTAAELQQLKTKAKQQEEIALQYETQIQFLQISADELKGGLEKAAVEKRQVKKKGDTEKWKVYDETEPRLKELRPFPDLLKAAEQRLHECEEKLLSCKRRFLDLSKTLTELQASDQSYREKSPSENLESLREEKHMLLQALDVLSWKLKEVDIQNQELNETMAKQEEAVLFSNCQLEERSRESAALSQQLEAALLDVSEKVREMKDQAAAKEWVFQNRILELESELNRTTSGLKLLQQSKDRADLNHKIRLQELKLSLEQSENQNRSIQNYIQFLKTSYTTMFGDGVPTDLHTEPLLDNVPTTLSSTA
ncbi:outer dense fiber protein 2-like [Hypanus sabinus]|uniref:outer dense fiber protein 2-like n=1 Tax=Hypanus sabinus TaxID=79690 RepID=UPI0028C40BC7|nr:outer dense fiber protein 2-like [Hypanus sabinus]